MNLIETIENSIVNLSSEESELASNILAENPDLPFRIESNKFIPNSYIVGEIQIGDTLIRLNPRNSALNLTNIFEMLVYVNTDNFKPSLFTTTFGHSDSFGINTLSKNYLTCLKNLIQFGLTGSFQSITEDSSLIRGRINFENYHQKQLLTKGVNITYDNYSINVEANQIIKSAILKLSTLQLNRRNQVSELLRNFDFVDEFSGSSERLDNIKASFFSTNPFYAFALEYSIKILKDLKFRIQNGKVKWTSFLENSNDIFESYVRKLLKDGLDNKVFKWEKPKQFAILSLTENNDHKYYSPDIIIDYDGSHSLAVLDAKNKIFNKGLKLNKLVDSADLYQLIFYVNQLSSRIGGLIYPTNEDIKPIEISVDNLDSKLFLFSINMFENFQIRKYKLLKEVKKVFSENG